MTAGTITSLNGAAAVDIGPTNNPASAVVLVNPNTGAVDTVQYPTEQRNTIGALTASATHNCDWIDLGEYRKHTVILAQKNGVASAGEVFQLQWSDDGSTARIAVPSILANRDLAYNSTSGVNMTLQGFAMGRYIRAQYVNGASNQTALNIWVTALHY